MSTSYEDGNGLEIAIIGMSGRFPHASNIQMFWQNLRAGKEEVTFFSDEELLAAGVDPSTLSNPDYVKAGYVLENRELFDAAFFGYSGREAEIMDPQHRLFLECAWEALEDAGHRPATYTGLIGTYAGAGVTEYLWKQILSNQEHPGPTSDYQIILAADKDYLATRVAYKLNLRGPALTVQTGCSSSLVAVHLACQGLLNGECDIALAGGSCVDTSPEDGYLYQEEGIRSPDGHCRTFDAKAQGSVGSSGVGLVALKRLSDALADGNQIYAIIKGSAINNDGAQKVSFTAPGVDGQAQVIRAAHMVAEVDADTISYVEAHGTGTPIGDPIEVAALTQAFRYSTDEKGFCAIGSVKTNVGHLDVAAGITGLIKTALMLKHREIPPSLHYTQPNPKIDFANSPFYVNAKLTDWETDKLPRRAGVSSFGIGGTNAHVILEEAPAISTSTQSSWPSHLMVLSARSDAALEHTTDNLLTYMQEHPQSNLADIAYTLQVGRQHFNHRRMLVCQDQDDALHMLNGRDQSLRAGSIANGRDQSLRAGSITNGRDQSRPYDSRRLLTSTENLRDRPVTFLFPGQGAQYAYMAEELYTLNSTFRRYVDQCCELLKPHLELDLRDVLYPKKRDLERDTQQIKQTALAQPALFVIEYALSKLWMEWGVQPQAMLGHSVGEYVAACLADVFSLEDALMVIAMRGKLMQALPTGSMLAVQLTEPETRAHLNEQLSLATMNGPSRCVVAGPTEAIEALEQQLNQQEVVCTRLHTSHAFHSKMMDPMLEQFTSVLKQVQLKAPKIPYASNLTGTWITEAEATNPGYWTQQLRQAVRFSEGSTTVFQKPNGILLEVGPSHILGSLLRQHPAKTAQHIVLSSLNHKLHASDTAALLHTLGQLWLAGAQIAWEHVYSEESRQRISLPTYPFERKPYWLNAPLVGAQFIAPDDIQMRPQEQDMTLTQQTVLAEKQERDMSEQTAQVKPSVQREAKIAAMLRTDFSQLLGENLDDLDPATTFLEMGADSLSLLQANQIIQSRYSVKIPFRLLLDEYPTIDALAALIDQKLPPEEAPVETTLAAPTALPNQAAGGGQAPDLIPYDPTKEMQAVPANNNGHTSTHVVNQSPSMPALPTGFDGIMAQQLQAISQVIAQQLDVIRTVASNGHPQSLPENNQTNHQNAQPLQTQETPVPVSTSVSTKTPSVPANGKVFIPYKSTSKKASFNVSPRQQEYIAQFMQRYLTRTQGSKEYAQNYHSSLADSRWVKGFSIPLKEMIYPLIVQRAQEARIWDVDGHEYVDTAMGFGSLFFGHSPALITEALEQNLKLGIRIGVETELVGKVARLLCEITGNERATFCNSGTEAVMMALRIARAITGRQKIALFAGSYHGTFDGILVVPQEREDGELAAIPMAPGVPPHMVEDVIILPFGEQGALDTIRRHAHELAAILVEPLQSRRPDLVLPEFLRELRQLATESNVALIFDEVVTGFRVHPGGIQALVGVQADITTYGKAMGGGLPIAAVAGKAEYMDAIDGGQWNYGDASFPEATETFITGTYFKHPLIMPVVWAILNHIKARGPALQQGLQQRTTQLVERLNNFCEQNQVPLRLVNFSSLYRFVFSPEVPPLTEEIFFYHMIYNGVYIWEGRNCFLSTAHTTADIEQIYRTVEKSITDMREGGFFSDPTSTPPGDESTRKHVNGMNGASQPQPTIQAGVQSGASGEIDTSASADDVRRIPLTDAQKELWIMAQLGDDAASAYNETLVLRMDGPLQMQAMCDALQELVNRHEALRTTFSSTGTYQQIAASAQLDLGFQDVSSLSSEHRQAQVAEWLAKERWRPFDLAHGPLFRATTIKQEEQSYLLILMYHHIIIDGWSCGTLMEELSILYEAVCQHIPAQLPQPMQYSDYVRWYTNLEQHGEMAETEAYWLHQFANDIPITGLPLDHPRPTYKTYTGARERLVMSSKLSSGLEKLAVRHGSTLLTVLLTGFRVFLHRLTGQQDIVVGTPAAGQSAVEGEHLVGHCVNLLPIRSHLNEGSTFAEYLSIVKNAVLDAFEHQTYPFFRLVNKLNVSRDASRTPIISTTLNLDMLEEPIFFGLETSVDKELVGPTSAIFDMDLNIIKQNKELEIHWDYNADLFDAATIQHWMKQFLKVLEIAAAHPEKRIDAMPLALNETHARQTPLGAEERKEQLVQWNATRTAYPANSCIHQLFEAQVDQHPQAPALIFGDVHLTYEQLNQQANQLAHYLQTLQVRVGDLVGLYLERDADMVIATLAILKAGAAYVPLDLAYPSERIAFMLNDTQMRVVLTAETLWTHLDVGRDHVHGVRDSSTPHVVALDQQRGVIAQESSTNLSCNVGPEAIAHVIYTSGSTGSPKGVTVPHRGVNRLVCETNYLQITPDDRVAQASNPSFDAATFEIWGALLNGALLVGASREVVLSPQALTAFLYEQQISILFLTTALFNQMVLEAGDGLSKLRCLLFGGEAADPRRVRMLLEHKHPQTLIHAYGPTENTTYSTCYQVEQVPAEATTVPIGKPIANSEVYVLNSQMEPTPIGVPGELYVGGAGLAQGYLYRPELTAERFVPHPFVGAGLASAQPGARLYKTGDIVKALPDGTLDFVGRIDQQVKIHGFRIELGEIEATLEKYPGVHEVIVLVREDRPADKRLVAYVVPDRQQEVTVQKLQAFLERQLPRYMVPTSYVMLEALPLTPNGKIDKKALPVPEQSDASMQANYVAPATPAEKLLTEIWQQVLGKEHIGTQDNFFELGGDSILGISIIARANQVGLSLTPKQIFLHQTIASLAAAVGTVQAVQVEQKTVQGVVPLTPVQHWFFEQNIAEPSYWTMSLLLKSEQALALTLLEQAFTALLQHHDALRLRYIPSSNEAGWQQVHSEEIPALSLQRIDLSQVSSEEERWKRLEEEAGALRASLNISEGPLLRVALFELGATQEPRLLIVAHHLLIDIVSWRILLDDLQTAYQQLLRGKPIHLPDKTTSFQQWARLLSDSGAINPGAINLAPTYWLEMGRTHIAPLPLDYPDGENTVGMTQTVEVTLSAQQTQALLSSVPKAYRLQVSDVLLAALPLACESWTGQRRLLIDLESHGREDLFDNVDLSRTVGWFTAIAPVLLDLEELHNVEEMLQATKTYLRRRPHGGIGYGILRYLSTDKALVERIKHLPQAQISFNYMGQSTQALTDKDFFSLANESTGPDFSPRGKRKYLLDINSIVTDGELHVFWTYSEALHTRATIERLANNYIKTLQELIEHCQSRQPVGAASTNLSRASADQQKLSTALSKVQFFKGKE